MKTKIVLGLLIGISAVGVVLGLLWTKNLNSEQDFSNFFNAEENIYIFNRPNECITTDLKWRLDKTEVLPLIVSKLETSSWKSVIAQQISDTKFSLLFEKNRAFRDQHLDTLCQNLGIRTERKLLSIRDLDNQWLIKEIGNYVLLSNIDNTFDNKIKLREILINRDRNTSFSCVVHGEIQEYYCFPHVSKTFISEKMEDLMVSSVGSMDFGFYNVVPKSVPFFEFLDKDVLLALFPDWQNSPLIEYVEAGVIFSAFNNVAFYVLPISDLFSAKEILESIAGGDEAGKTQIKELMQVIPNQAKSYAMNLENNLVLASSQGVLESIALSYQMQQGFNTTKLFEQMMRNSSQKIHYRWYNQNQLLKPQTAMRLSLNKVYGYAYFRNRDKRMRFVSVGNSTETIQEKPSASTDVKLLWNFSLKNIQSSFHLNANPVLGVYNPSERAFSVVDGAGQILNSITLEENIKSIHPLDKGFLLETFEKLYWIPERNRDGQRSYDFKGQIQSTIAEYIWNGEEFITFISEQKLHKLSLKTGKTETINIPVSLTDQLPQLHAFNHKGKLNIGYFSDKHFHALDVSANSWSKQPISGDVLYSEKIDGKIHFIEIINERGSHKILFGGEKQVFNAIKPNFGGLTKHNQESIWILKDGRDLFIYRPRSTKGTLLTINGAEISGYEPIFTGDRLAGVLILDDVQNEVHYFKRIGDETELNAFQKFRGSKFIKGIGNGQFITFVDGQLVAYEL